MEQEKKYRYNDKAERYARMNRFYIVALSFLWIIFLIYLLMKLGANSIALPTVYGNIFLIAVFAVSDFVIYFRCKSSKHMKKVVSVQIGMEFFLLGVQTDAEFIYFVMLGVMAIEIPFYDYRSYKKIGIGYGITVTGVLIVRVIKQVLILNVDSICQIICIYLMIFILFKVGSIAKIFSDHALGGVEEQRIKQKNILDGILDISKTVQEESAQSNDRVDELVSATQRVATSMEEITQSAVMTAQSIEEQNTMTQSIQAAIGETGEHSRQMVDIAIESSNSIQENLQEMNALKGQSEQIIGINREVTSAMSRLQSKTAEVQNIAGMILDISSQTNLLALNASIESARAGEAGKGFAVVAEQIRQLAEQTRNSTEDIRGIINELNENADEVVKSIGQSVEATENQNEKIYSAADSFERLKQNMTLLIDDINAVDQKILGLSDANNRIVENISQLSAATEEVTASAEQVKDMSEHNLSCAQEVKEAIGLIQEKTQDMKSYM